MNLRDNTIELMPWQQRLNDNELRICLSFFHVLEEDERELRRKIMKRETRIDLFWGFFDDGKDAERRRKYYFLAVHPRLVKQPKIVIHPRFR